MSFEWVEIGELQAKKNGSIDPSKFLDETFELYSIPSHDKGNAEILTGRDIGSSKQIVQENDVMISKIVPHIRRAMVVSKKGDFRQIASGEWIVFRSEKVYPNYLRHLLISDFFNAQFMATVSGVGGSLLRARPAFVSKIKIPLPPLPEQKRIAQILDKADELRQKRQQSIEKLDELLQTTFIDMFGDPLTNQKNWEISKLVNEIELIQIGPFGTQLHQEDYVENSIPLINPSHIRNGKIFPDNKLTVSEEKYHQLPQYHMKTNDVIVGRRGEMGRCAVVTERENGYFCGTGSLFLRMNEKNLNATFLSFILSSNSIKKLLENSSQGVTMANLNKKIVSEIPLIMPNIDLQSKFGEFVDSINLQKQRLKVQSKQQENLFQSLQQRAFNGEL